MKIHFVAVGGAAMHNLAIALCKKGYNVTGSDDEIFEPARSRLKAHNLLPETIGWNPQMITPDLDAVILGMHAKADNPELVKAQQLGIKIYSFPDYFYENTKNKTRVVIGGSHGKTTITAMVMHVLKHNGIQFDYMVGSIVEGFDTMVSLSDEAQIAVFEGDEYLASPLDLRPKFHIYMPTIALLSGIAWDHINVFPTFEIYVEQFRKFIDLIAEGGALVYCQNDEIVNRLSTETSNAIQKIPYTTHQFEIEDNKTYLIHNEQRTELKIFGDHNLQNISGAKAVCNLLNISDEQFYTTISTFKGAAKRLQLIMEKPDSSVFLDFAHSPSKLRATVKAVKSQFQNRQLVACMELHTFSSLNENFLAEYRDCMADADIAVVYFDTKTIEHKRLKPISPQQVALSFGGSNLNVFTNSVEFMNFIQSIDFQNKNLLLMSSGNFSGIDFKALVG